MVLATAVSRSLFLGRQIGDDVGALLGIGYREEHSGVFKDVPGKSNCSGQCLVNWPALTADASATAKGDWTVITRDEGTKQWAYKGKPLYYFVQDKNPGDMVGENRGGVWHIVK